MHKKGNGMDYIGKRFGRLVVIGNADKKYHVICKCDCGNTTTVFKYNLIKKKEPTRSCGCIRKERAAVLSTNIMKTNFKLSHAQNKRFSTNFQIIESKKLPKNNTSGKKGVSYRANVGKYEAYISAQRRRFFLGLYDNYSDAVNARLQAERLLHKPMIKEKYAEVDELLKELNAS